MNEELKTKKKEGGEKAPLYEYSLETKVHVHVGTDILIVWSHVQST
jgi:hypothetical protein